MKNYLFSSVLTSEFSILDEFGVNPFDEDLGIEWPLKATSLSAKDTNLPSLVDLFKAKKNE